MRSKNGEEFSNKQSAIAYNIFAKGKPISIRSHLDSLGRVSKKVIKTNKNEYTTRYIQDKLRIIKEIEQDTHSIQYEYDSMGNITKKQYLSNDIVEETSTYKYDKLDRLVEQIDKEGNVESFTYDTNGNIKTHQVKASDGALTTNEKYNYSDIIKDRLESITNVINGKVIKEYKYDNTYQGNPTAIITNGISTNLTWEGRRLKQVGDINFTYNEEGIRIKKLGNNFVENYILDGNNIIGLQRSHESGSYKMYFNYDSQGEVVGVSCEGKEYFYIKDITGNISKIIDEEGESVVEYKYDAWGNFTMKIKKDCQVAYRNPFIYKGYFYDEEINWY